MMRRVGRGLWGARLPGDWEIADAEMYAILAYLKSVVRREGQHAHRCRCLVASDCQSVLQEIEGAWRGECAGTRCDRGVMLDQICAYRRQLGLVVTVWVPSHRGIAMNAYADAAAKAYLHGPYAPATAINELNHVTRRTCVYRRPREHDEQNRTATAGWMDSRRSPNR